MKIDKQDASRDVTTIFTDAAGTFEGGFLVFYSRYIFSLILLFTMVVRWDIKGRLAVILPFTRRLASFRHDVGGIC